MILLEDLELETTPVIHTLIETYSAQNLGYTKSLKVSVNLYHEEITYLVYSGSIEVYSGNEVEEALEVYNEAPLAKEI